MYTFALLSTIVVTGALFSFLSYRVLRLPTLIGTMLLSLVSAAALSAGARLIGGSLLTHLHATAEALVLAIDFNQVVLHGMLAFLLFAGALELDLGTLNRERVPVLALSVLATALSTVLVGFFFRASLHAIGLALDLRSCLLFGALISPTDPIAVLEMLRRAKAPARLTAQLAGESLFNDGIGAVLFVALLTAPPMHAASFLQTAASSAVHPAVSALGHFVLLLLLKSGGAIGLGYLLGTITARLLHTIDNYRVEMLLTLALAMGGYALADVLTLSAPLEVVTAGLLMSGHSRTPAMSCTTRDSVLRFWELLDEILNVVLFLLLGLELLVLPVSRAFLLAGLLAIPVVLLARLLSVGSVLGMLTFTRTMARGSTLALTWGGLRGGLAIALALALPRTPVLPDGNTLRSLLLVTTYVVMVFSILVQGLTIAPLLQRLGLGEKTAS